MNLFQNKKTGLRRLFLLSLPFLVLLFGPSGRTFAAPADPTTFGSVTSTFDIFINELEVLIPNILNDPQLGNIPDMFWKAFSIILIINLMLAFQQRGLSQDEIFGTILLIAITRVLMIYFDDITTAMWGWSEGFAEGIQRVAVGNTDIFFVPRFTYDIYNAISFADYGLLGGVSAIAALIVMNIIGVLLGVLSTFAATWALWGYAVAKMVGWMFIPMIMFERLSWLFDGWLRFFFGFLVYGVLARANLVLVAMVLKAYFNLPSFNIPPGQAFFFEVDHLAGTFGLLSFLLIGALALISTGQFASSIAGGVGGFGSAVRGLAFGLSGLRR